MGKSVRFIVEKKAELVYFQLLKGFPVNLGFENIQILYVVVKSMAEG